MNMLKSCAVVAVALLVSACASGPKLAEMRDSIPALKSDQGRIYFYRSGSMMGAGIQPSISLNGTVVGESKPGGFFFVDRAPGPMEVAMSTEVERKLTFALGRGETRYVKSAVGLGVLVYRVYPVLVDNATGEKELEEMSYIGSPLR